MQLLDGKVASAAIKEKVKSLVAERLQQGKKAPHLAAILVGTDGASETYVASKVKTCEELGFASTLIRMDSDTTEAALLEQIEAMNANDDVDGILVQLPLPKHITELS